MHRLIPAKHGAGEKSCSQSLIAYLFDGFRRAPYPFARKQASERLASVRNSFSKRALDTARSIFRAPMALFGAIVNSLIALNVFYFISINRMDLLAHSLLWLSP